MSSTVRGAAAASIIVAAVALTAGTATAAPASSASCVATLTVAETGIAPGYVGEEVKGITQLGPSALPSLVRQLTAHHLGSPEACEAVLGE
ncbi:MAG: hypothetical protein ACRD1K_01320 [Acidimicrobiales bacterium]